MESKSRKSFDSECFLLTLNIHSAILQIVLCTLP